MVVINFWGQVRACGRRFRTPWRSALAETTGWQSQGAQLFILGWSPKLQLQFVFRWGRLSLRTKFCPPWDSVHTNDCRWTTPSKAELHFGALFHNDQKIPGMIANSICCTLVRLQSGLLSYPHFDGTSCCSRTKVW